MPQRKEQKGNPEDLASNFLGDDGGGVEPERGLRPVVAKFGGTSMGDSSAIGKVAEILIKMVEDASGSGHKKNSHSDRTGTSGGGFCPVAAVVSATSGTTDKLIALGEAALKGGGWEEILAGLIQKHEKIVEELGLSGKFYSGSPRQTGNHAQAGGGQKEDTLSLRPYWEDMRKLTQGINLMGEMSASAKDKLMSFGERIGSRILAALLEQRGVKSVAMDAHELVFTDDNFGEGNVDFEKTNSVILEKVGGLIEDGVLPVITGFIGQATNGHYITLGRGGSDYSGAIVAGALQALELQIWTDVNGIFNTDPRLVKEAKVLDRVSFNEAGELAYFGAKVLHPKTIKPAIEKNIPVKILNTFNPAAVGTLITNEEEDSLKSVTYKKGISIINICSAGMLEARGFLAKLFEVFARHGVEVDVVSTSEVSVSVTVDKGGVRLERVVADLSEFAKVNVEKGLAIVCLVGAGIAGDRRVLGELFSAVNEHDVMMVSQGASKRNITFLVKEAEAPEVVRKVFNRFFK